VLSPKAAAGMDGAVEGIMPAATARFISVVRGIIFTGTGASLDVPSIIRGSVAQRATPIDS
jgi:hypothetical protein